MEPTTKTETLDIEGMTCASCASFVEKSLTRTPGVHRAVVNFATEKATVDYVPTQATPATLKEAVVNAGYGVTERAPTPAPPTGRPKSTSRKRWLTKSSSAASGWLPPWP
ncbi:heavy metal-associated domain-containing protein [Hymenobacter qilianensis]|uniref:heavy metal-associated domain-containing protein n=1 Tax=Hymenobacter qilianensis TaxID=1385715 RepID=UPI00293BF7AC|nr:heavy metal-associated domain-containing protein [Hymenobacter qilianensis]